MCASTIPGVPGKLLLREARMPIYIIIYTERHAITNIPRDTNTHHYCTRTYTYCIHIYTYYGRKLIFVTYYFMTCDRNCSILRGLIYYSRRIQGFSELNVF